MTDRRRAIAIGSIVCSGVVVWLLTRFLPAARQPVHLGLALVIALLACWLGFERLEWDDRPADLPEPETRRTVPAPGGEIDRLLDRWDEPRDWQASHVSNRLRERLEAVALDDLVRRDGLTRHEAQERIADGAWTDDPVAAAFLAGREPPLSRSLLQRIDPLSPTPFVLVIRRTVDALLRRADRSTTDLGPSGWQRLVEWSRRGASPVVGAASTAESGPDGGERDGSTVHVREISHWRGIGGFGLLALAAGFALEAPGLLLGGAIALGYVGYGSRGQEPTMEFELERVLSDTEPEPGTEVAVTVTVRNESERTAPDVRVVDGVPEWIEVVDGSPRHATALRPGERSTFTYEIEARRGTHRFQPATVLARDIAESVEVEAEVATETLFVSKPSLRAASSLPLRNHVAQFVGNVPTRTGGDGVELHSVREYRRGDSLSRIDWKRRARTGEFATVAFREERAANVVVAIDSRESAHRAPAGVAGNACDRGAAAAANLVGALLASGNRVGVATLHPDPCWLPVRTSSEHGSRIRDALATHPSLSPSPSDGECYAIDWLAEFRARYDAPAQVVFVSPLCDDTARYVARSLEVRGYPVTLVSVDPTSEGSPGQRFARLERLRRLHRLRTAGVRVVDWQWDEPVGLALVRAERGWTS